MPPLRSLRRRRARGSSRWCSSFAQYRLGYAVAVVLALFFVFVMGKPSQHGFAVGLLLLVALGLTIDFYAERRAMQYESACRLWAHCRPDGRWHEQWLPVIPTWQPAPDRFMMRRINIRD